MMARWAVLGASSFSGRAFCGYLRDRGEEVAELSRPGFDIVRGLGPGMDAMEAARPEHIINFIALNMVAESWAHFEDYYRTNVIATAALAEALRRRCKSMRKFVQVSTPEVYGTTEAFLREGAPFRPSTPYAVSRAAADMHLAAMHRTYGFPVCFTRSVNVYGPGQQLYRIVPKTAACVLTGRKLKLHGGGRSTRSFLHIRDQADAIRRVAEGGRPGETYHTSTERQTSIADLVRMICVRMGARFEDMVEIDEERPGKDMTYQLDSRKIRNELGWRDRIGLEQGLDETIAWVRGLHLSGRLRELAMEYEHRP